MTAEKGTLRQMTDERKGNERIGMMNTETRQWMLRSVKSIPWHIMLKGLMLYVLPPTVCMMIFAQAIGDAVRTSGPAAYWILLAAFGMVCLNWIAYTVRRRKHPSLLVYTHGTVCLLLVVIIESEALLNHRGPSSTLAVIGGCLALVAMFMFSFRLAAYHNKLAHSTAVVLWVIIGFVFAFMAYRVARDIEANIVSADTWITAVILVALIPAAFSRRILASCRAGARRRRATALAEGRIVQLVGETRLDRYDDLVTDYYARVQYTVDGMDYETHADISKAAMRLYGRKAFIGREILVRYEPENPAHAYTRRVDRRFLIQSRKNDPPEEENEENSSPVH